MTTLPHTHGTHATTRRRPPAPVTGASALTALIAMAVTVAAGLAVTWQALSARPAPYLRNE